MKIKILKATVLIVLVWLAIVSVRIMSSLSKNLDHRVDELGSVMFDGSTVTFYYDSFLQNNHGIYFSNDADKFAHTASSPVITSKDGKTILYVEFTGAKKVVCQGEVVEPFESIEVTMDDTNWSINTYILESEKQYYQIGKDEEEYTATLCTVSATGSSSICNVTPGIDSKGIINMVTEWESVDKETVINHEFITFLTIHDNKEVIGGIQSEFIFSKSSLNTSILSIKEGNNVAYYQLNQNQVEILGNALSSNAPSE